MPDLSTCNRPTCAVTLDGKVAICPKCGGPMRAVRESRTRGWVLLCLGLFLVLFMGAITWSIAPIMLNPGVEIEGSTFDGTAEQAQTFLTLFGAVILFGLLCVVNGLHWIVTGRQSRPFRMLTLALAAGLFAIGWAIRRGMV